MLAEIKREPSKAFIELIERLLEDVKSGQVVSIVYMTGEKDQMSNYAIHNVPNKYETAGRLMSLADLVLHENLTD